MDSNYLKLDGEGDIQEVHIEIPVQNKNYKLLETIVLHTPDKKKTGILYVISDGKTPLNNPSEIFRITSKSDFNNLDLQNIEELQVYYHNDDMEDEDLTFIGCYINDLHKNPVRNTTFTECDYNDFLEINYPEKKLDKENGNLKEKHVGGAIAVKIHKQKVSKVQD